MDNVLNKILCILSCIILVLGIIITSFFVSPVFAVSEIPVFSSTPSVSTLTDTGFLFLTTPTVDSYVGANNNTVRVGGYTSGSNVYICALTNTKNNTYVYQCNANSASVNTINYQYESATNGIYLVNLSIYAASSGYTPYVTLYSSKAELISNYDNIDSVPSFEPLYDNFNIPRGYLAWIEWNFIPESLELSTSFPNNSDFWNSGYVFNTQWVEYYHGSSVITIPAVLSNGGSKIPWVKGGNTNIWGQSKEASATLSSITGSIDSPSFICNPVYQSGSNRLSSIFNSNELPPMNGSITIHDSDGAIKKIRLYSLTAAYNSETDSIDNTLSYDTPSYSVDVDENGVVSYQPLNSTAPAVSSPIENGGTYVDPSDYSTSDIISTINNAFSNLISRIEAIFHPAAGYFQSLLNSFNDFVHWLSNLWVWLPAPIVTLIEAVLYISISVGLIKLVLK